MAHIPLDRLLAEKGTNTILSPVETRTLVSGQLNAEILTYIYLGLTEKKIDPNELLASTLENFNQKGHLLILALAIRKGADVNAYPGNIHILILAGRAFRNVNVDLAVGAYAILIASGSSPNYKARKQPNTDVRTVLGFLSDENVPVSDIIKINDDRLLKSLKSEYRNYIGIVLDRDDLVTPLSNQDEENVIAAFSSSLYPRLKIFRINSAIITYNNGYMEFILKKGAEVSYRHVNEEILQIKKTVSSNMRALTERSTDQLGILIKYGAVLDKYQYAMLLGILKEKAQLVADKYSEPRWKKECNNSAPPSKELKRIAFGLQVDDESKDELCTTLNKYSTTEKGKLIEAARMRQNDRLIKKSDLLSTSTFVCSNRSALSKDPLDLPNIATVSYISKGERYCIPSELYELTLKTGTNPYNSEPLPPSILTNISDSLEQLRKYKVLPVDVPNFSNSLLVLGKPDQIGLDEDSLKEFAEIAVSQGVTKKMINSLTPRQGERLLSSIGINTNLVGLDSPEHATMTVIQESLPVIGSNSDRENSFFSRFREIISA